MGNEEPTRRKPMRLAVQGLCVNGRVLVLCAYLWVEFETRFQEKQPSVLIAPSIIVTEGISSLFHFLFLPHDSGSIVSLRKDNLFFSLSFFKV